jgi:hypothetical protein
MDREALRFDPLPLGEGDLGEEIPAQPPGGLQALEGGPVLDARLGDEVVEVLMADRLGSRRRPGDGVEAK